MRLPGKDDYGNESDRSMKERSGPYERKMEDVSPLGNYYLVDYYTQQSSEPK